MLRTAIHLIVESDKAISGSYCGSWFVNAAAYVGGTKNTNYTYQMNPREVVASEARLEGTIVHPNRLSPRENASNYGKLLNTVNRKIKPLLKNTHRLRAGHNKEDHVQRDGTRGRVALSRVVPQGVNIGLQVGPEGMRTGEQYVHLRAGMRGPWHPPRPCHLFRTSDCFEVGKLERGMTRRIRSGGGRQRENSACVSRRWRQTELRTLLARIVGGRVRS